MIRTQIQLTDDQAAQLRSMAARLDVSVAEVVRRLVERASSAAGSQTDEEKRARAVAAIGRYSSGRSDVSAEHDRYLAEAYGE